MTITIRQLDHLVLTVADIDATVDFYTRVSGRVGVSCDAALPPQIVLGKAHGAGRGVPRSSPATLYSAICGSNPKGQRPLGHNPALSLAHVARPHRARDALSCDPMAAGAGPDETSTRPSMQKIVFGEPPRTALAFGSQKINLHPAAAPFEPRAGCTTPGSADLCFIADTPLDTVIATLHDAGVDIIEGPVDRSGATGGLRSVYIRDPDANLIEISNRQET